MILGLILYHSSNSPALDPKESIYTVTYSEENGLSNELGTAFRLNGVDGLVTSLHCVSGKRKPLIRVSRLGLPNISNKQDALEITAVCEERDLAILSCPNLQKQLNAKVPPLPRLSTDSWTTSAKVWCYGTKLPEIVGDSFSFLDPAKIKISALLASVHIAEPERTIFKMWGSPSQSTEVAYVGGYLRKGWSGGPVRDSAGRVFAVASGSFEPDEWFACPLIGAKWEKSPHKISAILDRLAGKTPSAAHRRFKVDEELDKVKNAVNKARHLVAKGRGTEMPKELLSWGSEIALFPGLVSVQVYKGDSPAEALDAYELFCQRVSGLFPDWKAAKVDVVWPAVRDSNFETRNLDLQDPETKLFVMVEAVDNGKLTGPKPFPDWTRYSITVQIGNPQR